MERWVRQHLGSEAAIVGVREPGVRGDLVRRAGDKRHDPRQVFEKIRFVARLRLSGYNAIRRVARRVLAELYIYTADVKVLVEPLQAAPDPLPVLCLLSAERPRKEIVVLVHGTKLGILLRARFQVELVFALVVDAAVVSVNVDAGNDLDTAHAGIAAELPRDRKSTRLNS